MPSAALHRFGRQALAAAWPLETGSEATLPELQIAGAVSSIEGGYGTAKFTNKLTGESRVINNWGAVRSGSPPCDGITGFEATDSSPLTGEFQQCFRIHNTPTDGAQAFIHEITTRRPESWAAMKTGDIDLFSKEMHTRHGKVGVYYQGFGATDEIQIAGHAAGVLKRAAEIAEALGEPLVVGRGGPVGGAGGGLLDTACDVALGAGAGLGALYLLRQFFPKMFS